MSTGGTARHWRAVALVCALAAAGVWIYFLAVTARHETMRWYDWLRVAGMFWTLSFGVLLAWRRPEARTVRLLSAALIGYALFDGVLVIGDVSGARFHGSVAVGVAEVGIAIFSCVLMAHFASQFVRPLSVLRRCALVATYAAAAGTAAGAIAAPFVSGGRLLYAFTDPGHYAVPRIAALLCGVLAVAASRHEERQRVGWPFASFGVLYAVSIVGFFAALPQDTFDALVRMALFVMPLGITYSALARRLYDVGFIVNRALVFSGVSGLLIGSFVLLEWALATWFGQASRETSLAANVALALAFGISLRFVHRRVDRLVDNVFFKRRHDDVLALKRFAQEAAFVTDRETLVQRACSAVLDHSEVSSASIMLIGEDSTIDPNDPAILAMRTWHEPIELHDYRTALVGEYAFPLSARGTLVGALVCGAKRTGEAFAPDEIDALKTLAYGVGIAYDRFQRGETDAESTLRAALASFQDDVIARFEALTTALRALSRV